MKIAALFVLLIAFQLTMAQEPVTPNASPEAKELLGFIYSISGQQTLTGQHGYPLCSDILVERVHNLTGEYPAVFGQDFGFSKANTLDAINFRQRIVDNAIKWHEKGMIITLMWHATPPTMDEPCEFKGGIQSKLTDEEWQQLITNGTAINEQWKSQVDVIAFFLKQLRNANVPVLWRPYHEMNGNWFWWGNKQGSNGYAKLYQMMYERLVVYHKINNLIWVFNANEVGSENVADYDKFYPGDKYVDVLATDVYHNNYQKSDYQSLLKLANGKPIALGEVGHLPTPQQLIDQPKWAWFMVWSEHIETANTYDERVAIYKHKQTMTLDEVVEMRKK
jgi:mannan endo-1,4-beta-mannosidase